MAALHLRNETTGQRWQLWPCPDAVPPGAVHENGSYLFELSAEKGAQQSDLLIDDVALEALRTSSTDEARWRWRPGFHAGVVDAELRLPGTRPVALSITTDPELRKLTRDHFDKMVGEILQDTFALFSLSAFHLGVGQGPGRRPPPIARLEFLRSKIEEIEQAVYAIARSAQTSLQPEVRSVPYYRAGHATGMEVIRAFRSGRLLREAGPGSRLPAGLQGMLPANIQTSLRRSTHDTPENRQIGACLRAWSAWLVSAAELLAGSKRDDESSDGTNGKRWARRCRQLSVKLSALASLEPFSTNTADTTPLRLSAVFRRNAHYRRFYELWRSMNLGIANIFGDFLNLPLARTFDLYELWCYLRLLRGAAVAFGPAELDLRGLFGGGPQERVVLPAGSATAGIAGKVTLCFQRRYQEFWRAPDGRGSFSREMTPDIVLTPGGLAEGATKVIVLDAKYRVDQGLNEALSSIHTYRDALVQQEGGGIEEIVSAAYLLTPAVPGAPVDDYRKADMPARLFHPVYRSTFRFGAVTLSPGLSIEEVAQVLKSIIADATALQAA